MYRVAKLLQELLCEELGDGGDVRAGALVALEGRLVRAIEDEDGVDSERDQAEEAIVEGAQCRIGAAYALSALLVACADCGGSCLCWLVSGRAIWMCL
jgi:hypothetical protein